MTIEKFVTKKFLLEDQGRTFFPLATNSILIEHGEDKIRSFIAKIFTDDGRFLNQSRVHAAKDQFHLRRTMKLDVVAEYFLYDVIYSERAIFRKPHSPSKASFGYRFQEGRPILSSASYKEFRNLVSANTLIYGHFVGFDISSYFNHIYHHDSVSWFATRGANETNVKNFSKFFREINAGRSLDCLPQGLYPAKMIGSDFLRFVEDSHALKSEVIIRFMDDFYLFSDSKNTILSDFDFIQRLLGQKGLSVNAAKTSFNRPHTEQASVQVNELKKRLLERRRKIILSFSYDEEDNDSEVMYNSEEDILLDLSEDEIKYIESMLRDGRLEEEDAELILTVMRKHTESVKGYLPHITREFPHLAKNIARFVEEIEDKEFVAKMVFDLLSDDSVLQEYQLFWFGMMLERSLLTTSLASSLISLLFDHVNSTDISKCPSGNTLNCWNHL